MGKRSSQSLTGNSEHGSLFLYVCVAVLLLTGCSSDSEVIQSVYSGPIMGTEYRVTVVHASDQDVAGLESSIIDAMQAVNLSMSNYIEDSELSRFNRSASNEPFTMSPGFAKVMQESQEIAEATLGAFDVTLGRVINLWGFGPDGSITRQPDAEKISVLKDSVGYRKLRLDGNALIKTHDDVSINLSAIAKGYAVDQVAETLSAMGFDRYLINIGGELRASGTSLSDEQWRVGIEKPHVTGGIQQVVRLGNQAIATSGDYRNYYVIDGQHFSHTIDPQTLKPVFHKLALVSIISDHASTADAMATALMAMGEERAMQFAEQQNLAAYMIIRAEQPGEYQIFVTDKFKPNLP